jgi:AraC-like DNA-binding protein
MFYVNATQTESAIAQLTRSDISLIDLADELGFSPQGNFTRFFRQHGGVTPNRFHNIAISRGSAPVPHTGTIPANNHCRTGGAGDKLQVRLFAKEIECLPPPPLPPSSVRS